MPHSRNNHLAKRSQPTYEELKLSFAGAVVAMVDGSQPTYEELKRLPEYEQVLACLSSQPTYEELKPDSTMSKARPPPVPSLPMRN